MGALSGSHPSGHATCGVDGASRFDPGRMRRVSECLAYLFDDEEIWYEAKASDVRALLALAHATHDWQPINTAPQDGSRFFVFSERSGTYDFAQFDKGYGYFTKDGCGWDDATHWTAIATAAGTANDRAAGMAEGKGAGPKDIAKHQ